MCLYVCEGYRLVGTRNNRTGVCEGVCRWMGELWGE